MEKIALQKLWEKENNAYREKEIGSGVQLFVKKILLSEYIFNLREAKLSTPEKDRKLEFLEEYTKKNKRADIIIFADEQVVIPMEIERFGNIQAGEKQLFQYQLVWDKKTGILTDGYEWRFYVGKNCIQTYYLPDIFDKTNEFLLFWAEYTQAINYYRNFFAQEQAEDDLNIEAHRHNFFSDITTLINNFRGKLAFKGYFNTLTDKTSIELTYAYLIQFILYKTLADNDFEAFKADFDTRLMRIKKNLDSDTFSDVLTVTKAISSLVSKNIYRPFKSEQEVINQTLNDIQNKPTNDLPDITPWLDIFVFIKRYSFANIRNEIFGFIYENYLKQLYNENLGQYFTAPEVVDFMLDEIGYKGDVLAQNAAKNKISIIDPSCGSGTFLYSAVRNLIESLPTQNLKDAQQLEKYITENIFGIDVSEFPLYLAEMGIIMRMLPLILNEDYTNVLDKKIKVFKTKDSIAEFLDTAVKNTLYDAQKQVAQSKGQAMLDFGSINLDYRSHIRDEDDLRELKRSLENQETNIDRYRFDYVIGNPPYISYNECSARGILSFQFIKEGKLKLNDIYGVNLHSVPNATKGYRPNPNLYAFFISLGLGLLKEGGKMCYIVPQTLLTAGDLDVLRYHLAKYTTLEKMILVDSQLFTSRGLKQNYTVATSNLIFVTQKKIPINGKNKVKISYHFDTKSSFEACLEELKNENKEKIKYFEIAQDELLANVKNWNFLKLDQTAQEFYKKYLAKSVGMENYFKHQLAQKLLGSIFYFDGGYMVMEKEALLIPQENSLNYEIAKIDEKRISIPENKRYIPNQRGGKEGLSIKLRQANQGYFLLDSTYKIVWSTRNPKQFHFTDRPIIWANNRLGGIGTENKEELLFLCALLNSDINKLIIRQLLNLSGEKDLLLQINFIKEFIKIPIILDNKAKKIKQNIINLMESLLALETLKLSEFVDFSNVLVQKFDDYEVLENTLILKNSEKMTNCKIKKTLPSFVALAALKKSDNLTLHELKNLLIVDENQQNEIKKEINNLFFCLYFDVKLSELAQNKLYLYLQNTNE